MEGSADILAGLASGRTSMEAVEGGDESNYRLAGYRLLGKKAVRVDILERLADLIRPAASWRFNPESPSERPEGAWDGGGFLVTPAMLSILGATHENMADILRGIGYRGESKLETEIQAKLEQWDVAARAPAQPVGDDQAAPADAAETSDATPAPEASTSEAPAADDDATLCRAQPEPPRRP